jgi:hypothetical protein
MDLYEVIEQEMQNDDEPSYKKSQRLMDTYERADASGKAYIDDVFMTLTGWSFPTLMKKAGEE